jgi:hypothetical protein
MIPNIAALTTLNDASDVGVDVLAALPDAAADPET